MRGLVAAAHAGPSAVVAGTALGLGVAAGASAATTLVLTAAVLAGQLSIGWSNDWLDAARGHDRHRHDKPIGRGEVDTGVVRVAALLAVGVAAGLSLLLGPVAAATHLSAVASAWLYNVVLKHTPASVVPYLLSFGLLPSIATTAAGVGWAPWWATAAGACFGAGVHFANVLPDLEVDALTGVRGLPQRVGPGVSVAATTALLGFGTVAVLIGPGLPGGATAAVVWGLAALQAALLAVVVGEGVRGRHERAFHLAMASGLLVVALLLARGAALG